MQGPSTNNIVIREGFALPVLKVIGMGIFFIFVDGFFVININTLPVNRWFFIVMQLVELFILVYILLKWFFEYYEIVNEQITHKKGILFSNKRIYTFKNIESVKLKQGIFGKIFGFGTISIYSPILKKTLHMYMIPNSDEYLLILEKMIKPDNKIIITE